MVIVRSPQGEQLPLCQSHFQYEVRAHGEMLDPVQDGGTVRNKATCVVERSQGDSGELLVRIPPKVAKQSGLCPDQPIRVQAVQGGVMIRTRLQPSLTLAKMLVAFDPKLHGGEVLATPLVGNEVFGSSRTMAEDEED
jgi:antitoxin MazE